MSRKPNYTDRVTKKPTTRKAMIDFLISHFRYDTMNSWNRATSYAVKVKINQLQGLDKSTRDKCYDMLQVNEAFDDFNYVLREFGQRYRHEWQIGQNGRSGGYLVLYQGGQRPSQYKSWCTRCGQGNCNEATSADCKCGRCGQTARQNQTRIETFTQPGLGTDGDRDYEDWDTYRLKQRVALVMDFDRTCEAAVDAFVEFARQNEAVEKTIHVPKKIMVARPV